MTYRDDAGIGAVAHFGLDPHGEHFIIRAIAQASRCAGNNYGTATLEFVVGVLRGVRRSLTVDFGAFARVHSQNHPGKLMLREVGFCRVVDQDSYEVWAHDLSV